MHLRLLTPWSVLLLLCGIFGFQPQLQAGVEPARIKELRGQAEFHEQQAEWDKACVVYEMMLKLDRQAPEIQERYQSCWRRYWQVRRHADLSYRREVLSLDYAQTLRLYTLICQTLQDNALDKKKVDPGSLFRKGLEELDHALTDPYFLQEYLPAVPISVIRDFREFLKKAWALDGKLTKPAALKQLREIALAAQNALQLNGNLVLMEFACGACYALDEYTFYLTPSQLQELCDSLRGEFVPSVAYHMKSDCIGYMHIDCFQDTTLLEIDEALESLGKDGMQSLILDIRGNGGGIFEVAIDVARRFLSSGVIASTQNSDPKFSTVYQARNPKALTVPLVLLIDGDTASSAEILAGALKDNKRARLVGQTTFGKGCTQCILKLPSAPGAVPTGGIRLTIARFFSPEGLPYANRGVAPHIPIAPLLMDSMSKFDPLLDAALLEAQRLLTAQ